MRHRAAGGDPAGRGTGPTASSLLLFPLEPFPLLCTYNVQEVSGKSAGSQREVSGKWRKVNCSVGPQTEKSINCQTRLNIIQLNYMFQFFHPEWHLLFYINYFTFIILHVLFYIYYFTFIVFWLEITSVHSSGCLLLWWFILFFFFYVFFFCCWFVVFYVVLVFFFFFTVFFLLVCWFLLF